MSDINLENIVSDLSDDIHKQHIDLSLSVVKDIIRATMESERVEDYFNCIIEERNSNTPMNLLTNFDCSLETIETKLVDIQNSIQNIREEVTPILEANNKIVVSFKNGNNSEEQGIDIDGFFSKNQYPDEEITSDQIEIGDWNVDSNRFDDFIGKMQDALVRDFCIPNTERDKEHLLHGTYIRCCYDCKINLKLVKNGHKHSIDGFREKGLIPLLAARYINRLQTGTYWPDHDKRPNEEWRIIEDKDVDKYNSVVINVINNTLLENSNKKVTKDNFNDFIKHIYQTFVKTNIMIENVLKCKLNIYSDQDVINTFNTL